MMLKRFGISLSVVALAVGVFAVNAFAVTVPAVPVDAYGDTLLTSLASALGNVLPYAAAITAFAIAAGMIKRWLGSRKATKI